MSEKGQQTWARAMVTELDAMLVFADKKCDTLLAAKVEEVRIAVIERYLSAAD
ncbi:hypothetical protein [Sphingomonas faeni]|uniref:hypothetical protein n=1 Tax=Sphingomonas faeni TaxID=185950 RepID=UPI0033602B2E